MSGTQKMFLILFRNILCPQQMFPSLRSMETQHSFCVPRVRAPKKHHEQQCVRNNVSSFANTFRLLSRKQTVHLAFAVRCSPFGIWRSAKYPCRLIDVSSITSRRSQTTRESGRNRAYNRHGKSIRYKLKYFCCKSKFEEKFNIFRLFSDLLFTR